MSTALRLHDKPYTFEPIIFRNRRLPKYRVTKKVLTLETNGRFTFDDGESCLGILRRSVEGDPWNMEKLAWLTTRRKYVQAEMRKYRAMDVIDKDTMRRYREMLVDTENRMNVVIDELMESPSWVIPVFHT